MKKFLLVLVLAAVAGGGFVYVRLGSIVKTAIEREGPKLLGAPVTVGLVTLSPFSGKGSLRNLRVGNPEGFQSKDAITVGGVDIELDVRSLLKGGKILIKRISVEQPEVTLETGSGGTNLQRLQKNLASKSGGDGPSKDEAGGRKVEISKLTLRGGKVTALVPQLKAAPQELALPDLELNGIGAKSGGATAAEASKQVLDEIVTASLKSAGGPKVLLEKGLDALKGIFKK